jgi:hypothetical protein
VIIIPDIEAETMQYCIQELYKNKDASMLRYVLGVDDNVAVKTEEEDEDHNVGKLLEGYDDNAEFDTPINSFVGYSCEGSGDWNNTKNEIKGSGEWNNTKKEINYEKDEFNNIGGTFYPMATYHRHKELPDSPVVENPGISDLVAGNTFANETVVRDLLKLFIEEFGFKMAIASNNKRNLLYVCPCSLQRKPRSLGIRKVAESKFTGCPANLRFFKKMDGSVKLTRIVNTHNHDQKLGFPLKGTKKAFNWNSVADAVVRDGLIGGKSVEEMREMMESEGIEPLPTLKIIQRRYKIMKKMLGIDYMGSNEVPPAISHIHNT